MAMIDVRECPAGPELDAAVSRALGWAPPRITGRSFWSTNIAAAWELDGEGWTWRFHELHSFEGLVLMAFVATGLDALSIYVDIGDDKEAAYAWARCCLWLLAQGVEKIEVQDEGIHKESNT